MVKIAASLASSLKKGGCNTFVATVSRLDVMGGDITTS